MTLSEGTTGPPADLTSVRRLVAAGTEVAARSVATSSVEVLGLWVERGPRLARLAMDSRTHPQAAWVLRDEVLGFARELAEVGWRASRRAIDDLDHRTRSTPSPDAAPVRRARAKP